MTEETAKSADEATESELPVGDCPACGRPVVVYPTDELDEEFACVHCDAILSELRWLPESALGEFGYVVADPTMPPRKSACATGCGTGGCGPRKPA